MAALGEVRQAGRGGGGEEGHEGREWVRRGRRVQAGRARQGLQGRELHVAGAGEGLQRRQCVQQTRALPAALGEQGRGRGDQGRLPPAVAVKHAGQHAEGAGEGGRGQAARARGALGLEAGVGVVAVCAGREGGVQRRGPGRAQAVRGVRVVVLAHAGPGPGAAGLQLEHGRGWPVHGCWKRRAGRALLRLARRHGQLCDGGGEATAGRGERPIGCADCVGQGSDIQRGGAVLLLLLGRRGQGGGGPPQWKEGRGQLRAEGVGLQALRLQNTRGRYACEKFVGSHV
mmetsp:Transcript_39096/g.98538  ORF Transcript_39096/g.98538 Transcript_39096/m.98538 type:complete len:286 (-) Transcript_39096:350-1207(-)